MSHFILSFIAMIAMFYVIEGAIHPHARASSRTLEKLDLRSLEGRWHAVYTRDPSPRNGVCPSLDVVAGRNHVTVTEKEGRYTTVKKLEQNQYLKGKISKIINKGSYNIEEPWYVLQVHPVLVVYQVNSEDKTRDKWAIYSRSRSVSKDTIRAGERKLIEAGAELDRHRKYGYPC